MKFEIGALNGLEEIDRGSLVGTVRQLESVGIVVHHKSLV